MKKLTANFFATAPYSKFQYYGTKAHGPKKAKVMMWKKGRKQIFAKWVRGIKGDKWIEKAIDMKMKRVHAIIKKSMTTQMRKEL